MSEFSTVAACDAIANTLATAAGIMRVEDIDELTEQIPNADMPLIQVYPNDWELDAVSSTHKFSFGGTPVQNEDSIIIADIFIEQVAHVAQSMTKLATIWDALKTVFRNQATSPAFGYERIQSFQVRMERVVIEYSTVRYAAIRSTITLRSFAEEP